MSLKTINEHIFFSLSNDMRTLSAPLNLHLKIHYFAFKRTYNDGSKIYLFNHANYYEHWFNKQYYLIGNREARPSHYENSYDLWDSLPDPHKLYDEGAKYFDIAHGLTITRKHVEYCDFFFFATCNTNSQVRQLYFERRDIFEKYCDYFIAAADQLIKQAEKSKIILPLPEPIKPLKPILEINKFLNEIKFSKNDLGYHLTKREIECANLLAEGRSYKDIARIYGLSPRTVEEHSYNLRHKLGCKNKSELIALLSKKNY